ncbi:E3 ubiquitin-protein ligase TRIM56-like [Littorina saxatilis]|uniref:E3 ubiquitin-protein ligase TRIM56-like n=1 Tax=Littorina saxatilis TaxID=31220 RepID=UPI0038B66482
MATAAGASSADNDTECSVCHELFKNPKLLPCAHVLCRHCLLSWLASNPEAFCPLCRGAIADPKEKSKTKRWEEVVDVLPDDVAMAALVESTRVLSKDHVCVGCKSAAVSICLDCNDMMCQSCSDLHTRFSAISHHKVEDLSSMTAGELAASQPDHCSVHTSKPCELFCPTHGAAICHLCASAKHRTCLDLTELAEAADKSREELSQMVTSLLTEEQQLEEAVAALERHLEATEKAMQDAVAEIDRTCDKLENSVKECRRRLKKMTLDAKVKVKDTVLAVKVTLLDHRGRLTSHRRVADRTTRGSTNKGMCDVTRALRGRVKDLLVTCGQRRADLKSVSMVTLTIDTAAVSRIEKELSDLGQVKISPTAVGPVPSLGWRFHTNHGKNIVLSNDGLTAESVKAGYTDGIVVADQSMVPDVLYEIQIDKLDTKRAIYILPCGVVLTDPDHLRLPDTARNGWGSEAVVISDAVYNRGHRVNNNLNKAVFNLSEGTRVGVMMTTKTELHLWVNGSDRGVIATTVPTPCFAFFDLRFMYPFFPRHPLAESGTQRSTAQCLAVETYDVTPITVDHVSVMWNYTLR